MNLLAQSSHSQVRLITIICIGFIIGSEINTYEANTRGIMPRTDNIVYAHEFEVLMARVVILIRVFKLIFS